MPIRPALRLFAFDSAFELDKLARAAPGAQVFCRILVACEGAEWPLSRKFGCAPDMAVELLRRARDLGLDPYGVSFHVGSQQTDLGQWDGAVGTAAHMFSALAEADVELRMVNIGGGFPGTLSRRRAGGRRLCPSGDGGDYPALRKPLAGNHHRAGPLTGRRCRHYPERGRADLEKGGPTTTGAGSISMLANLTGWPRRWTRASNIGSRHRAAAVASAPVILAGPTCDSADILYEHTEYRLPLGLRGRRQGRDPVSRRLHRKLRLGRVQWFLTDPDLLYLSGAFGRASNLLHQLSQHRSGEVVEGPRGGNEGRWATNYIGAIVFCEPGFIGQDRRDR